MSAQQVKLCSLLLKEYYGEIVSNVGNALLTLGPSPLRALSVQSGELIKNVKKSLIVLIQHGLVTFIKHVRGFIEYKAETDKILCILRYPKYIYIAKSVFGDFGEQIVEELLMEGILTADGIIKKVYKRMKNSGGDRLTNNYPKLIYEVLVRMIQSKFIYCACIVPSETNEPLWYPTNLDDEEDTRFSETIPPIAKIKQEIASDEEDDNLEPVTKRQKTDETQSSKENFYYMVNPEQFHIYLRNMAIIDGLKVHYDDEKAALLVQAMLKLGQTDPWAKETLMITKTDIVSHCLRENLFTSKDEIELYLLFLSDDNSRFVVKVEERAGVGMYRVNVFLILDKLIQSCVTSIVTDRFGSQCGRIFRLLLTKRYLTQKQIEELAMIPTKEAKEYTYNLFTNNYVKIMQYPKGSDYAPSGTYFLFNIDLEELCRMLIERCYQAIFNCIIRRNHENETHKALIERKTFIDAVITNLRLSSSQADVEQQIEELNQSFSTHDRELLERLKKLSRRLELSEIQVDDTLFLFQSWLTTSLSKY